MRRTGPQAQVAFAGHSSRAVGHAGDPLDGCVVSGEVIYPTTDM
jgi:inorganic pyrophosphatase